jgi:Flavin containing amine oxidoreductase
MSGGTPENAGFLDMLHWWAFCDYRSDQIGDYEVAYKLKCGTSGLAQRILEDELRSSTLAIKFSSPVQKAHESVDSVSTTTVRCTTYTSAKLISNISLNFLKSVKFSPRLLSAKVAAIEKGHVGLHSKIYFEVRDTALRFWSEYSFPGRGLLYAYGDDNTPTGNTDVVAFGSSAVPLHGEDDIEKTKDAILYMRKDLDIKRVLFHNS